MANDSSLQVNKALIWSIAEILRGDYRASEYQRVILPFLVLRRLDAVLEPKREKFLETIKRRTPDGADPDTIAAFAKDIHGVRYYNLSPLSLNAIVDDPERVQENLTEYVANFSPDVREVFKRFLFDAQIKRLADKGLLYQVTAKMAEVDLHPETISHTEMGYMYEELLQKFAEMSNETAGEHFTPREVIRLLVDLLLDDETPTWIQKGKIVKVYDPAAGTGGMLSIAEDKLLEFNSRLNVATYGQELNDETFAMARSDMLVKGQTATRIVPGNTLTEDGHIKEKFDILLANPPYGVDWGKYAGPIIDEHKQQGFKGRFGPGLPRKSDGSLLFLLHMISKMKDTGSRIGIVFNGSPLFTGAAGGGESEIRRWILENDWLDAIVALPEQLFYNTGIATYLWILTNSKTEERKGKVRLVDARGMFEPMRKSLGDKRRYITPEQIAKITRWYSSSTDDDTGNPHVKLFDISHFGYMRITVERPMRRKFVVDTETFKQLETSRTFKNLAKPKKNDAVSAGEQRQTAVRKAIQQLPTEPTHDFGTLWNLFEIALQEQGMKTATALHKMLFEISGRHDPDAPPVLGKDGKPLADPALRDQENVPLEGLTVTWAEDPTERIVSEPYRQRVAEYMEKEVLPWVSGAWVDHTKTKLGYEIPLTREFYVYEPPRPLKKINTEIEQLETEILELLREMKG